MEDSGWLVVSLLAVEAEFSHGVAGLVDYFSDFSATAISITTHPNV